MTDWVKRALTRKRIRKGPRGDIAVEEANMTLVYGVKFALGMTCILAMLEFAHIALLHAWNSEIFAAITGLIGTVTGVLIGRHA